MNPVKITVELTVTPEMFVEWCAEDIVPSERMYRHYVEKILLNNFGISSDYEDVVNTTIFDDEGKIITIMEQK